MKFSVSLYSFSRDINSGKYSVSDCLRIAKEIGFDAVEAVDGTNFNCPENEFSKRAYELRNEAEKHGLYFSALAVGADFLNGSGGDTRAEIARIKRYVDTAEILGAGKMRHDITSGYSRASGKARSYESLLNILSESCREIAEYALSKNVTTLTENHGFFSQDSERVEKLYNAVDHPNFGLLCDIGNFMCADEDPALAVARVAPYTKYVHAKDFIWKSFKDADPGEGSFRTRAGNYLRGTVIGHGNVPVLQCLHILKSSGYDDTIALEFEGIEAPETGVRIGLANLKKYWEQA